MNARKKDTGHEEDEDEEEDEDGPNIDDRMDNLAGALAEASQAPHSNNALFSLTTALM